jgi:hypothetical protein
MKQKINNFETEKNKNYMTVMKHTSSDGYTSRTQIKKDKTKLIEFITEYTTQSSRYL